jgi:hypothetical protein
MTKCRLTKDLSLQKYWAVLWLKTPQVSSKREDGSHSKKTQRFNHLSSSGLTRGYSEMHNGFMRQTTADFPVSEASGGIKEFC